MRDDIHTSPIVLDLETHRIDNAAQFLEPVEADKRLTDPAKIAADIKAKEETQLEKCSLDPNLGRVAVIGWWTAETGFDIHACRTEVEEVIAIAKFWEAARPRTIVGYNIKGFDLRFLVQRSRFKGIAHPQLDFSPYSRKGVHDLFFDLTFNDGHRDTGAMRRTLSMFCRRFDIPCDDTVKGADVPALLAAGKWDQVIAHCRSDVEMTVLLAQQLGVVATIPLARAV